MAATRVPVVTAPRRRSSATVAAYPFRSWWCGPASPASPAVSSSNTTSYAALRTSSSVRAGSGPVSVAHSSRCVRTPSRPGTGCCSPAHWATLASTAGGPTMSSGWRAWVQLRHISAGGPQWSGCAWVTSRCRTPALMWRSWTQARHPLDIVGPPAVLASVAEWTGEQQPVRPHAVKAGDRLRVGGYNVRVLAAAHSTPTVGPAVLYDLTGPDGTRLLWATDTGPLPARTLDEVRNAAYDVVLLEETAGDAGPTVGVEWAAASTRT